MTVVRLTAPSETIEARLRGRDSPAELEEHLREAAEMNRAMDRLRLEDWAVDTGGLSIAAVAVQIARRWADAR